MFSAEGIETGDANQTRSAQPRSLVRGHVSKALSGLPVSASGDDLLFRSSDEVPPHENLLRKRWSPDEQQAASCATGDAHFGTSAPDVVENPLFEWLIVENGVAVQNEQCVFESRLKRQCQGVP